MGHNYRAGHVQQGAATPTLLYLDLLGMVVDALFGSSTRLLLLTLTSRTTGSWDSEKSQRINYGFLIHIPPVLTDNARLLHGLDVQLLGAAWTQSVHHQQDQIAVRDLLDAKRTLATRRMTIG